MSNSRALITAVLLLLLGSSSVFLVFHNGLPDLVWSEHATLSSAMGHRKLKEESSDMSSIDYRSDLSELNLKGLNMKDYHLVDPPPSSRTVVKSGPIEHGAPVVPWITTKPPPPGH